MSQTLNPNRHLDTTDLFISYAHSSQERKRSVAILAAALRSKGLTVTVDTDVNPLIGPTEGWPRWMNARIKRAKYVLMFFDETYRCRFDGEEVRDQGLGANFEGCIITHQLYRSSNKNDKFIPLLADNAAVDLIPDELFGFNRYFIPQQTEELAQKIVMAKATAMREPPSKNSENRPRITRMKYALWRLAYAFLRLDQLQSGGWGKSLPQWMEAIWQGDAETITRSPDMRTLGGTDFSCRSFQVYAKFVERVLAEGQLARFARNALVPRDLSKNLKDRIDHDGELGGGLPGRRVPGKVNIRHTAMGMLSLLLCGNPRGFGVLNQKELRLTASYLIANLKQWQRDKSYTFGMFAALSKLAELLDGPDAIQEFQAASEQRDSLAEAIKESLDEIGYSLNDASDYEPLPHGTYDEASIASIFFVPYGRFWRMERSGFLMYLPLLLTEEGQQFLPNVESNLGLKNRIRHCLHELLEDVLVPLDLERPNSSLIRYHRDRGIFPSPRDWGLSAQLLDLLRKNAIRQLLAGTLGNTDQRLDEVCSVVESALVATFDTFHRSSEIFKFTQSLSFSSILGLFQSDEIRPEQVIALDAAINELLRSGITEESLDVFVRRQIFCSEDTPEALSPSRAAVRDMLLEKLEPGEHTQADQKFAIKSWDLVKRDTIDFYNRAEGVEYVKRYGRSPIVNFVSRLDDMFQHRELTGYRALDLACGPGQYAKLLQEKGFVVDLYDASEAMLRYAAKLLGRDEVPQPRDYFELGRHLRNEEFDLIFASAMMVHVPLQYAPELYRQFYRILKPGGVLFANFKIGDNSLISLGGRYYEYYRNREGPRSMVEAAGFKTVEIIERWNDKTLQNTPRRIHWANFFFVKPNIPQ